MRKIKKKITRKVRFHSKLKKEEIRKCKEILEGNLATNERYVLQAYLNSLLRKNG
jgi:hypothetical protein